MKFGIVTFPGSNCDYDAYHAVIDALGEEAVYLWHKTHDLQGSDVVILPGGFSHAYIRQLTGNGGNPWDDTYRISAGSRVWSQSNNAMVTDEVRIAGTRVGQVEEISAEVEEAMAGLIEQELVSIRRSRLCSMPPRAISSATPPFTVHQQGWR